LDTILSPSHAVPPPRQTLSYLQQLFRERGIQPKSKLGQNFLIDLNLIDLILRGAELGPDDLALEIGSGTGSLTARLAASAGAVVSVEVDPAFHLLASELIGDNPRVLLLGSDALKNKNHLNPRLLDAVQEMTTKSGLKRIKLVANLPYSVATPVIANFLLTDLPVERMVVTVQWEIAERMLAEPGHKSYGSLAVLVQSIADVELLRQLRPSVFFPRPKVDSAIICIRPNKVRRAALVQRLGDVQRLRNFLRDLYTHRRKNLRGALAGSPSGRREKPDVDRLLAEAGIDGTARSETLTVEQHLVLCEAFG
jgi:16S rRNA (adenine1518-N6/adenine1519-N6)-dimethyltransferase